MYLNSWNSVKLVCGNHGDDYSHEMKIKEYTASKHDTAFYSCPEYISIYQGKEGRSCNNRLSVRDFEKMLNHLTSMAYDGVEEVNLTGYHWRTKNGIEFRVLSQENDQFVVSVRNIRAIQS